MIANPWYRFFTCHTFWLLRKTVIGIVTKLGSGRLLDVGAGQCWLRGVANNAGISYVGVDAAVGDENWDYSHLDNVCNADDMPFEDGSYDLVVSSIHPI